MLGGLATDLKAFPWHYRLRKSILNKEALEFSLQNLKKVHDARHIYKNDNVRGMTYMATPNCLLTNSNTDSKEYIKIHWFVFRER